MPSKTSSTLNFEVITIHPQVIESYCNIGVVKKAIDGGSLYVQSIDLRQFSQNKTKRVDDKPFGGSEGMVLRPEPLASAVKHIQPDLVIALGPHGEPWSQKAAQELSEFRGIVALVCGRFSGIDSRFYERYVHREYSLGDYILSGGELAALTMIDTIARLLPQGLGDQQSAHIDSFSPGLNGLLEYPLYTRPQTFEGLTVPSVLSSGDHGAIEKWRHEQSLLRTKKLRPDLLSRNLKK